MTNEPGTITKALMEVKNNDSEAVEILWQRFFERLCGYAESRIYRRYRRIIEPDQIATDAFMALVDGVRNQRFEKVRNRDDLWQVLTLIAGRKTILAHRRLGSKKRGGGRVRGESVFNQSVALTLESFVSHELAPTQAAELEELSRLLLEKLPDDTLRQVAILRMAGFSNQELALRLKFCERTIERKLNLIRKIWTTLTDDELE